MLEDTNLFGTDEFQDELIKKTLEEVYDSLLKEVIIS